MYNNLNKAIRSHKDGFFEILPVVGDKLGRTDGAEVGIVVGGNVGTKETILY